MHSAHSMFVVVEVDGGFTAVAISAANLTFLDLREQSFERAFLNHVRYVSYFIALVVKLQNTRVIFPTVHTMVCAQMSQDHCSVVVAPSRVTFLRTGFTPSSVASRLRAIPVKLSAWFLLLTNVTGDHDLLALHITNIGTHGTRTHSGIILHRIKSPAPSANSANVPKPEISKRMGCPGFEPGTYGLRVRCSIQLS